jgi:hypothetical protein
VFAAALRSRIEATVQSAVGCIAKAERMSESAKLIAIHHVESDQ